ncbi:MAG TPA: DUF4062 domain-containing protein [Solirubrobacter sp.]
MIVYISSTQRDLVAHRTAVASVLRRIGHRVIGMEDYTAEGQQPLERCLKDVADAEVYVGILAWRYGSTAEADGSSAPKLPGTSSKSASITEYEYRQAVATDKRVLMFLLDPEAEWPASQIDALTAVGGDAIASLRDEASRKHLVSYFRGPDDLAGLVSTAVYRAEMDTNMQLGELHFDQRLNQPAVRTINPVNDSTLAEITAVIGGPEELQALQVHIGQGREWWMTRLYFLASLARDLTAAQVVVFVGLEDTFVGIADPNVVIERLARLDPRLSRYEEELVADKTPVAGLAEEMDRRAKVWTRTVPNEQTNPVFVTQKDLRRWLGSCMIDQAVEWDTERGNSPLQLQRLLDWPTRSVPIVETGRFTRVVDKQSLADQIARVFIRGQVAREFSTR